MTLRVVKKGHLTLDSKGYSPPLHAMCFYAQFCDLVLILFTDVNECVMFNPCKNGAACMNTLGSYMCTCLPGWTGTNCDIGK